MNEICERLGIAPRSDSGPMPGSPSDMPADGREGSRFYCRGLSTLNRDLQRAFV